ncbi:MAG: calmodulin [Gammaproteobacteria bacterium]|jgi:hypothetical protein|nr:calmodulin [Gammaproteobacteria bacterium]|tara:strand:- start:952 stop:1446 length:495 start_codon:yes stop_codon:yes gene_type:complete
MKNLVVKLIAPAIVLGFSIQTFAANRGEQLFDKMDTDGDKQISLEEFQPPKGGPGSKMLESADLDEDGMVTLDEAHNAHADRIAEHQAKMAERIAGKKEQLDEMFSEMDSNGDGAVTSEEVRTHIFSRMDKNEDGFLSPKELKRAKNHRREREDRRESRRGDDW